MAATAARNAMLWERWHGAKLAVAGQGTVHVADLLPVTGRVDIRSTSSAPYSSYRYLQYLFYTLTSLRGEAVVSGQVISGRQPTSQITLCMLILT